jgi:hypothetical protein
MTSLPRMNSRKSRAALLASLAAALLVAVSVASAAAVRFTHESFQDFQRQLSAGQVKAVTFNKKAHTVHVTLGDGRHVLASYPPREEPSLAAQIQAKGATVTVQKKNKAKAVHHKLRYIAAGVLLVLIVIVAAVLALNRRRPPAREPVPGAAGAASAGAAGAPSGAAGAGAPTGAQGAGEGPTSGAASRGVEERPGPGTPGPGGPPPGGATPPAA